MDPSSNSFRPSEGTNLPLIPSSLKLKCKTLGFALSIILGIGGVALGGTSYFHVGTLSNMTQVHAIITMAAGFGGGVSLLTIGTLGTVRTINQMKRCKEITLNKQEIETQGGRVYGPSTWTIFGATVLDLVPPAPKILWDQKDPYFKQPYRDNYALLYIPKAIKINGEIKDFNLQTLKEISKYSGVIDQNIEEQFEKNSAHGWVLMSKNLIPRTRGKVRGKVDDSDRRPRPSALEAFVLCQMIKAFAKTPPLSHKYQTTFTICQEEVKVGHLPGGASHPVIIGHRDGETDTTVTYKTYDPNDLPGLIAVQREFQSTH